MKQIWITFYFPILVFCDLICILQGLAIFLSEYTFLGSLYSPVCVHLPLEYACKLAHSFVQDLTSQDLTSQLPTGNSPGTFKFLISQTEPVFPSEAEMEVSF